MLVKLFCPGLDNMGSGWQDAFCDDYGVGEHQFWVERDVWWTKFRISTQNKGRMLQEQELGPEVRRVGVLPETRYSDPTSDELVGVTAQRGDVITVHFVVHELAFRWEKNMEGGEDDEDQAILSLYRLSKHLRNPSPPEIGPDQSG